MTRRLQGVFSMPLRCCMHGLNWPFAICAYEASLSSVLEVLRYVVGRADGDGELAFHSKAAH